MQGIRPKAQNYMAKDSWREWKILLLFLIKKICLNLLNYNGTFPMKIWKCDFYCVHEPRTKPRKLTPPYVGVIRKIFRKTYISNPLITRIKGLEMLVFRKILRTYLMDDPILIPLYEIKETPDLLFSN